MSIFKHFYNPPGAPVRGFIPFKWITFFIHRLLDKPPAIPPDFILTKEQVLNNYRQLQDKDSLTWLGHSTFLIKLNNKVILTDPFLTDYASPIDGFGPKRFTPPALSIQDLPDIDIILISHDHFDHLDRKTLARLKNKTTIHVVVPLCLGKFFKSLGFQHIHELDWHETWSDGNITFRALPVYHFSKRYLFISNTTLWAAYAIQWQHKQIYYGCDSAYGPIFLDMGRDYGPFDYALLSIGAYEPAEIMLSVHTTPELAVRIGQELRANILIPMHWGTIILSDEPPFEPPARFYQAALSAQYSHDAIWIFKIGETRQI